MWSLEMIKWLNRDKTKDVKPKVKISCSNSDFKPVYKHAEDAGADVKAYKIHGCEDERPEVFFNKFSTGFGTGAITDWEYILHPGMAVLVECGFKCELPPGYAFFVCPRSGLAIKNYITVLNAPGICDAGYRGEYGVILFNAGKCDFPIHKGDRIAQIVLSKTPQAEFIEEDLSTSDRGEGGFGSSGISDKKSIINSLNGALKDMKDTMKMCQEDLEKSAKEQREEMNKMFKESEQAFKDMRNMNSGTFSSVTTYYTSPDNKDSNKKNPNKNK